MQQHVKSFAMYLLCQPVCSIHLKASQMSDGFELKFIHFVQKHSLFYQILLKLDSFFYQAHCELIQHCFHVQ